MLTLISLEMPWVPTNLASAQCRYCTDICINPIFTDEIEKSESTLGKTLLSFPSNNIAKEMPNQ